VRDSESLNVKREEDEWALVLSDAGLLGPASCIVLDSGMDGRSIGEPGRDSFGRCGVLIEILREWG
jgi:hypothetical protein